ncbi:MAG TPA: amidohydrolase family protein [Nitriliruptorales bacterium]
MALALTGGTLIDGTGADPVAGATVVTDGERIGAVGADLPRPNGVEVIEVDGLTVLPGLVDLHTHMGVINVEDPGAMSVAETAAHLFRNAELCLLSGHTAAREVAGADGGLKRAIDQGLLPGPRLYPSGPLICQSGGHGDLSTPWIDHHHHAPFHGTPGLTQLSEVADGPDGVRLAVRGAFQRGATQIKVCVSGGVVSLTDSLEDTQFSVEELKAAVEEAHARGTYVTAHAHNVRSINNGLDAGLECFEHGTWLDEQTVSRLAEAGAALVPTLTVTALAVENWREWGIPEEVLPRFEGVTDAMKASLKLAFDAGVTIGSGTDILGPNQQRRGLEIALKAEVIGPMEAIVSATKTSAEILRASQDLGTVEEGKYADLIAVKGDPLAHPGLFEDADNIVLVVKGGHVVKDLRG